MNLKVSQQSVPKERIISTFPKIEMREQTPPPILTSGPAHELEQGQIGVGGSTESY